MNSSYELTQTGLDAVDYFLKTWNSRNAVSWADSLNFPHVRPSPSGPIRVAETADMYIAEVDFQKTIDTGWDHSEWDYRSVLQTSSNKIHASGQWSRYNDQGEVILTTPILYIITRVADHWGIQSRFGSDYAGDACDTSDMAGRGLSLVQNYINQANAGNQQACAQLLNYPHFKIGVGKLYVTKRPEDLELEDQALQIHSLEAIQTGRHSVNVAVELEKKQSKQLISGAIHINNRNDHLGIQAWSFMDIDRSKQL